METNEPIKKRCSKCGEEKELGEFGKNKFNKDGLQFLCKPCRYLYSQELSQKETVKKYKKNNKEKLYLRGKQFFQVNREIINEKRKINYLKNKNERLKVAKKWRENNKEKVRTSKKRYAKKHSEEIKIKKQQRHQIQFKNITEAYISLNMKIPISQLKQLPPEIIEAKRKLILLHRAIKNNEEITESLLNINLKF